MKYNYFKEDQHKCQKIKCWKRARNKNCNKLRKLLEDKSSLYQTIKEYHQIHMKNQANLNKESSHLKIVINSLLLLTNQKIRKVPSKLLISNPKLSTNKKIVCNSSKSMTIVYPNWKWPNRALPLTAAIIIIWVCSIIAITVPI